MYIINIIKQNFHQTLWIKHCNRKFTLAYHIIILHCLLRKLTIPLNGPPRGMSTTFGTKITIWILITVHPPTWLRAISHTDWKLTVNLTASNASSDDIMITLWTFVLKSMFHIKWFLLEKKNLWKDGLKIWICALVGNYQCHVCGSFATLSLLCHLTLTHVPLNHS